jgi:hypothetical protein
MMIVKALSVLSELRPASELNNAVMKEAPNNSNTIDTVVEVGKPKELNKSSKKTSLMTTARYMHITLPKVKKSGLKIPCRATSIIPLLQAAPTKTPTAATMSTCFNFAALEPTAELKSSPHHCSHPP